MNLVGNDAVETGRLDSNNEHDRLGLRDRIGNEVFILTNIEYLLTLYLLNTVQFL